MTLTVGHCAAGQAQLSLSAYRALGQTDLYQNGVNMVSADTLASPEAVAVDSAGHLYVTDTSNHRVLAWTSAAGFQNGQAAELVLGQPNPQQSNQHGIGPNGLSYPWGAAVDPITGDLYVADSGDNRVVRFPKPFANPTSVQPDAVYGQPDFATVAPDSSGITQHTLYGPRGVAFDAQGNLWVADTGNNRLLRFPAASLNKVNPAADLVLGQPDFHSGNPDRGGAISASGFDAPFAVAFDTKNNLYVADFVNTRVLEFPAPITSASVATVVYGQSAFTSRGVPQTPTSSSMAGPAGVATNAAGNLYVAVPNDNRVLVFAPGAASGAAAVSVLGQPDLTTVTANTGSFPQASATSLSGIGGVAVDSESNLYAVDSGNNRVLVFTHGSPPAARVLGQTEFDGNGPNQIKPGSINAPFKMAIDYSKAPFALYVSDTNNHRVLVWKDSAHFHTGQPADLVIGQPDLTTAVANVDSGGTNTPSPTGLFAPRGIALTSSGILYVADSGNNRVLRYPRPVDQSGRITPDAVIGQPGFTTSTYAAVGAASLHTPSGLAIGPNGDLFVADSGNNRVLEFASGASIAASAIRVYGQPTFNTSAAPDPVSAQTLVSPEGLAVDAAHNLYVADAAVNRVVIYPNTSAAPAEGLSASLVIGQSTFANASAGGGATGLNGPVDVALDSGGNIFVSDGGNNRVVVFPSLLSLLTGGETTSTAYLAVGQQSLQTSAPNWDTSNGQATPEGLVAPVGILVDRNGTLYVGDTGNSRVVQFLKPVTVVNGATYQTSASVGQGAWCAMSSSGPYLSTGTQKTSASTLPTSLASRQVVVNDQFDAPLSYFSPTQVNFVLPQEVPIGTQRIAVRISSTGELIAGGSLIVAAYSPGFFTANQKGTGQARAFNQDNSLNGPNNPAALGSVVRLFGTGEGPVVSPVADGHPAPLTPDNTVAVPTSDANTCLNRQPAVCVALGGSGGGAQLAQIQYSGLEPGQAGVWQVTMQIPASGLLGNTISVRALIGGANPSNLVTIAVK